MPTFRTSEELALRYAVTLERLLAYASRGNLSMCRRDGAIHFDEARVAALFPRRDAEPRPALATLGRARLGQAAG